ncbi:MULTISPECIES: S1 family peptidase [Streptomyces]|uniref:S1 family peptidase n=1 Tax=Streptomyces katsurahamanus TaxID=2577098 RepID=A0ABW9NSU1_9ACTN|nr:S1 family peptidase [Streptomyces katsurahamanus]MQS36361.1 S1 family peptidase [Streptomyces katsurahamanus]
MRRSLRARICLSLLLTLPAAGLGTGSAGAAPSPEPSPGVTASAAQYALDTRLERALGDDTAGSYLDPATGELVVTVTDQAAAEKVEAAGARAEVVPRSTAELKDIMSLLESRAKITGTSWGIDTSANQVSVEADSSVSARSLARLKAVAAPLGDAVRIERVPGVFQQEVLGGDAIYGGGFRCSAAFNVISGTVYYFLTAGHCTNEAISWSATSGGAETGTRAGTSFPGNDYGLVRYTDGSQPPGTVNLYNGGSADISSAADAIVGQAIQKSGSTTRLTSGRVTAVNVTVNYSEGPVYNMVRTTACSAGGDSGGAHFSGTTALGIHSGSSGCTGTNGSAVHQPVSEALSNYGVSVY